MDEKDLLIAAAIMANTTATLKSAMNLGVEAEMIKARTARREVEALARTNAHNAAMLAHNKLLRANDDNQQQLARNGQLRNENIDLRRENAALKREIAEMRETMREWVASQRGLWALAKALKDEIESCPNKEHHQLADLDARSSIGEAAYDASYDSNDAEIAIVKENPVYSKKNSHRKGKAQ